MDPRTANYGLVSDHVCNPMFSFVRFGAAMDDDSNLIYMTMAFLLYLPWANTLESVL